MEGFDLDDRYLVMVEAFARSDGVDRWLAPVEIVQYR